jgi:peptidoglycan/LPS O-acetylase OafA/YrhL
VYILGSQLFRRKEWLGRAFIPSLLFCAGVVIVSLLMAVISYELFEKRALRSKAASRLREQVKAGV